MDSDHKRSTASSNAAGSHQDLSISAWAWRYEREEKLLKKPVVLRVVRCAVRPGLRTTTTRYARAPAQKSCWNCTAYLR